jgi:hypothetical protein
MSQHLVLVVGGSLGGLSIDRRMRQAAIEVILSPRPSPTTMISTGRRGNHRECSRICRASGEAVKSQNAREFDYAKNCAKDP